MHVNFNPFTALNVLFNKYKDITSEISPRNGIFDVVMQTVIGPFREWSQRVNTTLCKQAAFVKAN